MLARALSVPYRRFGAAALDREATIADLRESNRYLRDRIDSLFALLTDRRPWWRRWFR
jgi:hypothetical protein